MMRMYDAIPDEFQTDCKVYTDGLPYKTGVQEKYVTKDGQYYIKVDTSDFGCEGAVEFLTTKLIECSNIISYEKFLPLQHVSYELCYYNWNNACISKNLGTLRSAKELIQVYTNEEVSYSCNCSTLMNKVVPFMQRYLEHSYGEAMNVLSLLTQLDFLTANTDRSLNNIVFNKDKQLVIIDNGRGTTLNPRQGQSNDEMSLKIQFNGVLKRVPLEVDLDSFSQYIINDRLFDRLKVRYEYLKERLDPDYWYNSNRDFFI